MVIKPTLGRIVWFTPLAEDQIAKESDGRCAAIVVKVWSDHMVNLTVFDANGNVFPYTSVPMVQENDPKPTSYFCEWMPFQKGQAARTQELERKLAN